MGKRRWSLHLILPLVCAACAAPHPRSAVPKDAEALGPDSADASGDPITARPGPRDRDGGSPEDAGGGDSEQAADTQAALRDGGGRRDPGGASDSGTRSDSGARGEPSEAGASEAGLGKPDAGTVANGRWVAGYYAAYQRDLYPPDQIDWSGLSHIIFARLKSDGGGRVQLDFDVDPTNGPELAREIARRAHENGRKALLMLGGAGAGTAIRDSTSDANRPQFVAALLRALTDLGYDGFDLDWEDDIDYERFVALARALRAAPNAPTGLMLTAPGQGINVNLPSPIDPRTPALIELLDQYNLMTYYPITAAAGYGWLSWHNCPLGGLKAATPVTIEESLARHAALGIPKSKLGMGIGFYAICYTGGVTAPNQSTEASVAIMGGDNDFPLSRLFASAGGAFSSQYRHWDTEAQVPYLTLPNPESHGCRYVSFDDEQSIEAKGAFTRAQGYGGTIVWTINQGWLTGSAKPANALMQALKRGFLDP